MQALINLGNSIKSINIGLLINRLIKAEGLDKLIIELNTREQLFKKGINIEGEVVGFYSPVTESIDPNKKAGTHFTFEDTGFFLDSWRISFDATGILIDADGQKDNVNLFQKYGENLKGLTDESLQILIDEIKRHLPRYILKEAFRIA